MNDDTNTDDGAEEQTPFDEAKERIAEELGSFEENLDEVDEQVAEVREDEDAEILGYAVVALTFDPNTGMRAAGGRVMNHEWEAPEGLPAIGVVTQMVEEWNTEILELAFEAGLRDALAERDDPMKAMMHNAQVANAEDLLGAGNPEGFGKGFQ